MRKAGLPDEMVFDQGPPKIRKQAVRSREGGQCLQAEGAVQGKTFRQG